MITLQGDWSIITQYFSDDKIENRLAGHVACIGESRGVYRVVVGEPERKRLLGRPRGRWEDNIKIDLKEVGGGGMDWMELVEDRDRWRAVVIAVMNLLVP